MGLCHSHQDGQRKDKGVRGYRPDTTQLAAALSLCWHPAPWAQRRQTLPRAADAERSSITPIGTRKCTQTHGLETARRFLSKASLRHRPAVCVCAGDSCCFLNYRETRSCWQGGQLSWGWNQLQVGGLMLSRNARRASEPRSEHRVGRAEAQGPTQQARGRGEALQPRSLLSAPKHHPHSRSQGLRSKPRT